MDVIKLPKDLGKKELLEELNARLKRNEVTLDWSRVEKASPPKLAALVAGLSLDVHADILGVDTVPEHLQQPLMAALERVREKLEREKLAAEEEDVPRPPSGTPAVFTAEEEVAPEPADPPPVEEEGQTEPPRPLLEAPDAVMKIIEAGNSIARSPYKWGGGHGRWVDTGYDCSGSVSYALAAAGLLGGPLDSGRLMSWGSAGRGKWVTVYANAGHVFMEVAGLRFDTSGARATGSRWQNDLRGGSGFVARHPPGL